MKDEIKLYYSKENIVFWIAGYSKDLTTYSALEKAASLITNAHKFAKSFSADVKTVMTKEILKSSEYRNMRVFYVIDFKGEVPSKAIETSKTFDRFIHS